MTDSSTISSFFNEAVEIMPSITDAWGLVFYSILAYLISFSCSTCIAKIVGDQLDIEKLVK